MRSVLHAIDTWGPGGAETICAELAAGLDPTRFRSVAAVIREGWLYDTLCARGVDATITRTGKVPFDISYLYRLASLARKRRVDLIQSHLLAANLYSALAARLLGIRAVATFHGMVDVAPDDRWARLKLRLITANVTRLVFVSEALRRHFCQAYPVAEHRTTVVHNGIDPQHFSPAPNRRLREELALPDGAILVGAVGNIRPAKGYDELLRVASVVRQHRPEIRFAIAGASEPELLDPLLAQRRALRLDDRVTFLGFRTDVGAVLNGVDLYLSTSTSEGFSLTTTQAMACGIPVVATRSGGPEEIVTPGKDGVLVPVGDTAAIARAVQDLAADPQERRRLADAGRETILRRFTIGQMVTAYETIYEDVVAREPGRRA